MYRVFDRVVALPPVPSRLSLLPVAKNVDCVRSAGNEVVRRLCSFFFFFVSFFLLIFLAVFIATVKHAPFEANRSRRERLYVDVGLVLSGRV